MDNADAGASRPSAAHPEASSTVGPLGVGTGRNLPGDALGLGQTFGRALCEHFGLPARKVFDVRVDADRDQMFGVVLRVSLSPDDLTEIAKRMREG